MFTRHLPIFSLLSGIHLFFLLLFFFLSSSSPSQPFYILISFLFFNQPQLPSSSYSSSSFYLLLLFLFLLFSVSPFYSFLLIHFVNLMLAGRWQWGKTIPLFSILWTAPWPITLIVPLCFIAVSFAVCLLLQLFFDSFSAMTNPHLAAFIFISLAYCLNFYCVVTVSGLQLSEPCQSKTAHNCLNQSQTAIYMQFLCCFLLYIFLLNFFLLTVCCYSSLLFPKPANYNWFFFCFFHRMLTNPCCRTQSTPRAWHVNNACFHTFIHLLFLHTV